uniref:Uncharacterized protein n=1 Tax=Anguilla anguilla TaxID=7936 RepID=A0A0E9RHH1_ANGAN
MRNNNPLIPDEVCVLYWLI